MDDKKYIESLSNFAFALEELVEEMQNQSKAKEKGVDKPSGKPLEIDSTLVSIQEGIDQLKDENKKIIDNQETLLKMNKDSKKSGGLMSGVTDKKNKGKIKDGVKTIILMAGAVLAIGLAFKVVGGVDFGSVIALSVALPAIAYSFAKISTALKENDMGYGDVVFTVFSLVAMAGGLVISSWLMSGISTVSPLQFLTAIGISITLAIVAIGASFMLDDLKKVKYKDILKLPFILVTLSMAIALSSGILNMTTPIDPGLLFNIVLQGISLAIVSTVFSIPLILFAKLGLKTKQVLMGSLNIVIVAGAIAASSHLLSFGNYEKYPSMEWSLGASVGILLFSIPVVALGLLSMTGIGLAAIALGGIMTIMVAGTISVVSHVLSTGNYDYSDQLGDWTKAAGGSIMLFSVPIIALGVLAMTGIGAIALMFGGTMAVSLSHTMVEISNILGGGDFSYGSSLEPWAKATNSLFTTFTPIIVALGAMGLVGAVTGMFGGPDPFDLAKKMLIQIAETIVAVSGAFAGGNWEQGPNEDWAKGVSLAIGAFAPVYSYLLKSKVMSALFGGEGMTGAQYAETMKQIAFAINTVGDEFSKSGSDWKGGPTEDWAEGVGKSISAFAPVFKTISSFSAAIFGIDGSDMKSAIIAVAGGIKEAGRIFSKDDTSYTGGPDEGWAKGVGKSIKVFTELYNWATDGFNWTPKGIKNANKVIYTIAASIKDMSKIFSGYWITEDGKWMRGETPSWSKYPSTKWTKGVTGALKGFADLYQWADDDGWSEGYIEEYDPVIKGLAESILDTGDKLSGLDNSSGDPSKYVKGLAKSLDSWTKVFDKVENLNTDEFWEATNSLRALSDGFNELAESLTNVGSSIESFNPEFIKVMADVSGVEIEMKNKEDKEKKEEEQASWWSKILGLAPEKEEKEEGPKVKTKKKKEEEGMKLEDIHSKLDELNSQLRIIAENSSNMSDYVDELRAGSNQGIEIGM